MTTHPLECPCRRCAAIVTASITRCVRAHKCNSTRAAKGRAALAAHFDRATKRAARRRRVMIATYEAGLLYEFMGGDLRLRRAAELASAYHNVPLFPVLSELQRSHGQGSKRGKPSRQEAA
jgi:hypothetical protein